LVLKAYKVCPSPQISSFVSLLSDLLFSHFVFSSYVSSPGEILVPRGVNAHHEGSINLPPILYLNGERRFLVELAIVIGKGGKNIPTVMAMEHISGYGAFLSCLITPSHL
jgi:hypothetical protein